MSGSGKRRREARRRARQRQEEQQPAQKPQAEGGRRQPPLGEVPKGATTERVCRSCHRPLTPALFCPYCGVFVLDRKATAVVGSRLARLGSYIVNWFLMIVTLFVGWVVWWLIVAPRGQNPGKAVVGLRVIRTDGRAAGTGLMFVRALLGGLLGVIPFYLDSLWLLWDRDVQTLHDKVAGTVVVKAQGSEHLVTKGSSARYYWAGIPVVVIGVVVLAVLILTSGSTGSSVPKVERTPDPRVAGQTPDNSISLNVDDVNFSLTNILGKAGEVIEFLVTNTGTQSHNMVVAGPDNEYDTADDFNPAPFAIKAGETGRVVVKIDDPGTYLFRCAFHPTIEFGTLVLD